MLTEAEKILSDYLNEIVDDKDWRKKTDRKEKVRKTFARRFPANKIKIFKLDDYIIGKQNNLAFCHQIERECDSLGRILGANASKFGVYYGVKGKDSKKKYRIGKKALGTDVNIALDTLKKEITKLVNIGKPLSEIDFKKCVLSPMFKGKILYIYHPEDYLPIYSVDHLIHFCEELAIIVETKQHYHVHNSLLNYKRKHTDFGKLTNMEFATILYDNLRPTKERSDTSKQLLIDAKTSLEIINISEAKEIGRCISQDFGDEKGKGNYVKQSKSNAKTGLLGELLVVKYEREKLAQSRFPHLAARIKHVSLKDDGLGYDIESFDDDGEPIYIEVKTSVSSMREARLFLSRNEQEVGSNKRGYCIYVVSNLYAKRPKLLKIVDPFNASFFKIELEPTQYQMRVFPNHSG